MPTGNRTVVVVEDDELMRSAIRSVLDARGYDAVAHASAEAALAADDLARARCAIVDVGLPGMSGVELCRRMRDGGQATPVILITGRDARHLRKTAHALGVAAYLVKPFSGRRLAELVDGADARRDRVRTAGAPPAGSVYKAGMGAGDEPDITRR